MADSAWWASMPLAISYSNWLAIVLNCYGLLCGAVDVKAIWKKCGLLIMLGYDAFNDLVNAVDPVSLADALNRWLLTNSDLLPKTLAIGGKGTLGAIITLCHHRTGAPLAMATYSGDQEDCELPVGQALLEQAAALLPNAVVTAAALHCQKKRQ